MTGPFWTFTVFAFLFGAVVGSFLNVVIHRVPAGESIVQPSSRCPECGHAIRWYDNIPLVSWFVLGGRCRECDAPIPARYTVVEAITALASLAVWFKVAAPQFADASTAAGLSPEAIGLPFGFYFLFLCLLIVITFVDLEHYIIPHAFTLPGIVAGLAAPWVFDSLLKGQLGGLWPPVTGWEALIGFLAGGLSVMLIYYAYFAVRGVQGIGGGDVTLMAMVGAWLGWPALVFIYFASSIQGTLAAAVAHLAGTDWLKSSSEILGPPDDADAEPETESTEETDDTGGLAVPFGPFITIAAVEHFFLGEYLPSLLSMSYLYEHWI